MSRMIFVCLIPVVVSTALLMSESVLAADAEPIEGKPVPDMQVIPLPYEQASFRHLGRELTRFHFGPALRRPFCYPLVGPSGRSHTRMGNPEAPHGERHHYSVWITHMDVDGVSFWEDDAEGRIVCLGVDKYADGPNCASLLCRCEWKTTSGKVLMHDRRRISVVPMEDGEWMMVVDLQLETPPGKEVVEIGQKAYGVFAVRVAKTISVTYGGGRVLNSQGQVNEKQVCFQPAKWIDYSGPIARQSSGGVALLDHPNNINHPTPYIVRDNGWIGACLTKNGSLKITAGKPLHLRYGLWVHADMPGKEEIEKVWKLFVQMPYDPGVDITKMKSVR